MAIVKVEGKEITLPDDLVKAGIPAIKAVLATNGFPAIENADIEIVGGANGAPAIVNVTPRSTGKGGPGAPSPYGGFVEALAKAPAYVNPAIALAVLVERAEREGDMEFLERAIKSGQLERAVMEGAHEGKRVWQALASLGHTKPVASKTVPVGF